MTLVNVFLVLIINTYAMVCLEASRHYKVFCETCGQGATTAKVLQDHMNKHTGEKPYVCEVCSRSFTTKSSYSRHMGCHGADGDSVRRPYQCDLCSNRFTRPEGLKLHRTIHTGEKLYPCEFEGCGQSFRQRGQRKTHYKKCHAASVVDPSVHRMGPEKQKNTGKALRSAAAGVAVPPSGAQEEYDAYNEYEEAFAIEGLDQLISLPVPLADLAALGGYTQEMYVLTACREGKFDIVNQWLTEGGNVDLQDPSNGATLLVIAQTGGHQGIVDLLLAAGADETSQGAKQ